MGMPDRMGGDVGGDAVLFDLSTVTVSESTCTCVSIDYI